jgi:TPR repeat protein
MRYAKHSLFVALAGTLLISCERQHQTTSHQTQPSEVTAQEALQAPLTTSASPSDVFKLGSEEISQLPQKALLGDADAAQQLAAHYDQAEDKARAKYWSRIALENGSPGAMVGYAMRLESGGGNENCLRALYWYKRAAAVNKSAAEGLEGFQADWSACIERHGAVPE